MILFSMIFVKIKMKSLFMLFWFKFCYVISLVTRSVQIFMLELMLWHSLLVLVSVTVIQAFFLFLFLLFWGDFICTEKTDSL